MLSFIKTGREKLTNVNIMKNIQKYQQERDLLLATLKKQGILDKNVLDVMGRVSRHDFVDLEKVRCPYDNTPQSIGDGQTISQPYIVALMTELLQLKKTDKVLEIGTGSGYQTSILCELSYKVYSVERIESLYKRAKDILTRLEYRNFQLKLNDGTCGWEEFAPYDAIIVTASSPDIPGPLVEQLRVGGRMIIPVGKGTVQDLLLCIKTIDQIKVEFVCNVLFVPLIGKHGWEKEK